MVRRSTQQQHPPCFTTPNFPMPENSIFKNLIKLLWATQQWKKLWMKEVELLHFLFLTMFTSLSTWRNFEFFFHRWKPLKRLIQRSVREELFKVSSQMLQRVERILLGKGRESCCHVANIVSAIGKVICFLLARKPTSIWIYAEEIQEKADTCWKLYNVTSISRIFSFVPQFESILFVNVKNIFFLRTQINPKYCLDLLQFKWNHHN